MGKATDDKQLAAERTCIEAEQAYQQRKRSNGGLPPNDEELTGPHPLPVPRGYVLVRASECGANHADCAVRQGRGRRVSEEQAAVLTEDAVKRAPVSGGIVIAALATLLGVGVYALTQHNVSAMSHPDIRAEAERARVETLAWRKEMRASVTTMNLLLNDTRTMLDMAAQREPVVKRKATRKKGR